MLSSSHCRLAAAGAAPLAVSGAPALASAILNPFAFTSSGALDLTSGSYTIDTSGGPGGVPVLENSMSQALATGSLFGQGGLAYSDSYGGGTWDPTIGVLDFSSVTIGTGVTVTVTGANPLALLSRGSETIDGQVLANGSPGQQPSASQGGADGAGGNGAGAGGHGGAWFVGNGTAGYGPGGGGINGPFTDYSPTYGDLEQYLLAGSGGSGAGVAIFAQYAPGGAAAAAPSNSAPGRVSLSVRRA